MKMRSLYTTFIVVVFVAVVLAALAAKPGNDFRPVRGAKFELDEPPHPTARQNAWLP